MDWWLITLTIFGIICGRVGVTLLILGIKVLRTDPDVYKTNQRAAILCRRMRAGTLSPSEQVEVEDFRRDGIIS